MEWYATLHLQRNIYKYIYIYTFCFFVLALREVILSQCETIFAWHYLHAPKEIMWFLLGTIIFSFLFTCKCLYFTFFVVVLIKSKGNFTVLIQALNPLISCYHLITLFFFIKYVLCANHLMGTKISDFFFFTVHQMLLINLVFE